MYPEDVLAELRLPDVFRLGALSKQKRADAIAEARAWPPGPDQEHKTYQPVSPEHRGLTVALGKPGKEAAWEGDKKNPYDMLPSVLGADDPEAYLGSFVDIFGEFFELGLGQRYGRPPEETLELVAAMLFRSAYMLDHHQISPGKWRWRPPETTMEVVESEVEVLGGLPVRTYLHMVEALAWNEDVKYEHRFRLKGKRQGAVGRQNNLLTCVNVIGVVVGRVPAAHVLGGMSRGVCPIGRTDAEQVFPVLAHEEAAALLV